MTRRMATVWLAARSVAATLAILSPASLAAQSAAVAQKAATYGPVRLTNAQELLRRVFVEASVELPLLGVPDITDSLRSHIELLEAETRAAMMAEARVLRDVPWARLQAFDIEHDLLSSANLYRVERARIDEELAAIAAIRNRQLAAMSAVLTAAQRRIFDSNVALLRDAAEARARSLWEWENSQIMPHSPEAKE